MSSVTHPLVSDSAQAPRVPRERRRPSYLLLASGLGYMALADLSLLPMLHVAGAPVKPAYAALALAAVALWSGSKGAVRRRSRPGTGLVLGSIALMAVSGLAGYAITDATYAIGNFGQTGRQLIVFGLMMTAYFVGSQLHGFRWAFLEVVLWLHGATILLLSWAPGAVPWLTRLWWKSAEQIEIMSAMNELRPTPFGDGSMVLMNILFLGVALSVRHAGHRLIAPLLTIPLTLVVSLVLASRNQMVATGIICASLMPWVLRDRRVTVWASVALVAALGGALLFDVAAVGEWAESQFRVGVRAIEDLARVTDPEVRQVDSVARPLIHVSTFMARFELAPMLGTGYSVGAMPPLDYLNMHNDVFWVLATSGIVGGVALCALVLGVYRSVGALAVLPFFLPGLTNTFLMAVSACLVYCFIVGLLAGGCNRRTSRGGGRIAVPLQSRRHGRKEPHQFLVFRDRSLCEVR